MGLLLKFSVRNGAMCPLSGTDGIFLSYLFKTFAAVSGSVVPSTGMQWVGNVVMLIAAVYIVLEPGALIAPLGLFKRHNIEPGNYYCSISHFRVYME